MSAQGRIADALAAAPLVADPRAPGPRVADALVSDVAAARWLTAPAVINLVALVVFATALCWRLDQIRRRGGGLQAVAMTCSVTALTLAFVVANGPVSQTLDDWMFVGAARFCLYGLMALGVAALIIVFFYPGSTVTRERRAGVEAIPLVAALIGLRVSLEFIPTDMRTASMSQWTLTSWGYALFYLIACLYLAYGLLACLRSIGRYLVLAQGYLRTALIVLLVGLGFLALASVMQIFYVLGNATGLVNLPWMLTASRWLAVLGLVGFLIGISFPMARAKWHGLSAARRRRRAAAELLPLWTLVTDAVPQVVLPVTGRLTPTALLHRRVVEIRDAITQLGPFLPRAFDYASLDVRAAMLRIAVAQRTAEGARSGSVRDVLPAMEDGLEADSAPLLELSAALVALPEFVVDKGVDDGGVVDKGVVADEREGSGDVAAGAPSAHPDVLSSDSVETAENSAAIRPVASPVGVAKQTRAPGGDPAR